MLRLTKQPAVRREIRSIRDKLRAGTFRPFGNRETASDWQPLVNAVAAALGISPGKALDTIRELQIDRLCNR